MSEEEVWFYREQHVLGQICVTVIYPVSTDLNRNYLGASAQIYPSDKLWYSQTQNDTVY
jgi:hypothetical protein